MIEVELGDLEAKVDLGYRYRSNKDRRTQKYNMITKIELRLKKRSQENDTTAPSSNTFGSQSTLSRDPKIGKLGRYCTKVKVGEIR